MCGQQACTCVGSRLARSWAAGLRVCGQQACMCIWAAGLHVYLGSRLARLLAAGLCLGTAGLMCGQQACMCVDTGQQACVSGHGRLACVWAAGLRVYSDYCSLGGSPTISVTFLCLLQ